MVRIRERIISAKGYIRGKVMGQNGGGFGLNFILKKIAKLAAFGLLLEALNYFLVQPNLKGFLNLLIVKLNI